MVSSAKNKARLFFSRAFFSLLGWVLLACGQAAADVAEPGLTISGFGSLGAVRTNTDQVEFVRDLSQGRGAKRQWDGRIDSLVGLQGSYQWTDTLETTVQAVSRYRYDRSFSPEIAWAFVKYTPTPGAALRIGRLGTDFFLLSDSRLVSYSYLQIRPPGDFFWHLPFYHIDGADFSSAWSIGGDIVRAKVFSGISREQLALADEVWDLSGSRMTGASLSYQRNSWLWRASYATIRFANDLPIAGLLGASLPPDEARQLGSLLRVGRTSADYYSLATMYESGPWRMQLMLNRIEQGSQVFEPSVSAYALAGYRLGSVTPYVGYGRARSSPRPVELGGAMGVVAAGIMRDSHVDQKTVTLGMRWDLARQIALKTQFDRVSGDPSSIFPYRRETGAWDGRINVFSLALDFIF